MLSAAVTKMRAVGANPVRQAHAVNNLGIVRYERGDVASAEKLFGEAHALFAKELGDEHPRVAEVLNNLAMVVYRRGDYDRRRRAPGA